MGFGISAERITEPKGRQCTDERIIDKSCTRGNFNVNFRLKRRLAHEITKPLPAITWRQIISIFPVFNSVPIVRINVS